MLINVALFTPYHTEPVMLMCVSKKGQERGGVANSSLTCWKYAISMLTVYYSWSNYAKFCGCCANT